MTDKPERIVLNDRYEIQNRIGRGGMADVFLARDLLLDRPVAIKVLFPEFATDPNFVERFRREAQAAANLNHPNIVSVYDWGKYLNTYFMAMEYVQGRTLADIMRVNGRLTSMQAAEIASEVAAALSFAHRNGVVHRDIKPANILIGSAGQVKVADFGIARAMNAPMESNLTQVGAVMGTATYFSPEQAQGAQPDPRSDLYSLGIVLYEMVSGRPPFTGDNPVGIAYKQVHDAPQPLNQIIADIPRPFEAIVAKLLAKSPAMRYPDADSTREDLRRFRAGEPVHALTLISPPAAAAAATAPTTAMPAQRAGQAAYAATAAMPRSASGTPTAQQPYVAPPPDRTKLYSLLGIIAILLLAIGGVVLYNAVNSSKTPAPATRAVPNVVGLPFDQASKALSDSGLSITPVPQENAAVAENIVFQTDPVADTVVASGSAIKVYFNPSKQPVAIPDVTGKNLEEAKRLITSAGLTVGTVTAETSDQPKETVIRTDPVAGTALKVGSPVAIVLSGGPNTLVVSDVTGQTQEAATALFKAEPFKFAVTVSTEANPTIAKGLVLRTEPAANAQLAVGGAITLIVSSGPEQVVVDPLVGNTEAVARTRLTQKGLVVGAVTYINVVAGDANDGRVISQSVPPGTKVDPGSTVSLQVGRAVEPATTPPTTPPPTTPPPTTPPTTPAPSTTSSTTT